MHAATVAESRYPERAITIFAFIGLLIISDAFRDVFGGIWQPIRYALYVAILFFAARDWKVLLATLRFNPFLTLLTLLAVGSIIWSARPSETLSRSIGLLMTTIFALIIARRFTIRQQVNLFALFMGFSVILSLIFVFALPQYGRAGLAWQGIYTQKNTFGGVMALGMLITLVYPTRTWRGHIQKLFAYVFFVFMVVSAQSATALVIAGVITTLFFAFQVFRLGMIPGIAVAFATIVPLMIAAQFAVGLDTGDVAESLGRNRNLTGRSELWDNVTIAINERPLTGYGYGAFWNDWNGIYGRLWSRSSHWAPGSAHNTYLDLWVNVGIFGVVLFMSASLLMALQAIRLIRQTRSTETFWPILLISFLFVRGYSEDFALYLNIFWALYIVAAYSIVPALQHERQIKHENSTAPYPSQQVRLATGI